jgi:hypothetical protein
MFFFPSGRPLFAHGPGAQGRGDPPREARHLTPAPEAHIRRALLRAWVPLPEMPGDLTPASHKVSATALRSRKVGCLLKRSPPLSLRSRVPPFTGLLLCRFAFGPGGKGLASVFSFRKKRSFFPARWLPDALVPGAFGWPTRNGTGQGLRRVPAAPRGSWVGGSCRCSLSCSSRFHRSRSHLSRAVSGRSLHACPTCASWARALKSVACRCTHPATLAFSWSPGLRRSPRSTCPRLVILIELGLPAYGVERRALEATA